MQRGAEFTNGKGCIILHKLHFVLGCRAKGVYGHWSYENVFELDDSNIIKFEKTDSEEEK